MKNGKRRLQDHTIKTLAPPTTGRLELKDEIVPGLVLRVTPRGVRSFSIAYKVPGEGGYSSTGRPLTDKQHRITLGTWPMLSLKAAREQARILLESVSMGVDPRSDRRRAQVEQHANTVSAVAARFIKQDCKGHVASWKRIERSLELHVLPVLGNKPIRDITRTHIHNLLDAMGEEDGAGIGAAREVRKQLHKMFEWALDREIVESNPAHKLKRKDLKPNKDAGRALTDDELRAIWHAADSLGYPYGPWIKLLMLTGQRRSEWMQASRAEIDFDGRVLDIPAGRYKTGRDHTVPLVGPAWEIVSSLPVQSGGDFLFSTTGGAKAINSAGRAKRKLDKLALAALQRNDPDAALTPWQIHDLRKTCETRLAMLGIIQEHRDPVLGHAKQGMQRIYNKHEYLDEKRAALDKYATHLMGVVS